MCTSGGREIGGSNPLIPTFFTMQKVVVVISFIVSCIFSVHAQKVLDTIPTPEGTMIVYANRTWEYMEDQAFDGIMNQHLHDIMSSDTSYKYFNSWETTECYSAERRHEITKLKDTVWLCLTDTVHQKFKMPFNGIVTSRYGYRHGRYHNGIDLDLEVGDTVRAAFSGKVRYSQYNGGGFGNLVIIRHYNGLETYYAHLEKCLVAPNQLVKAGDPIGMGGNTGHSYGSHLHFEVRFMDAPMNPEQVIDFKNKDLQNENLLVYASLFNPGAASTYSSSGDEVETTVAKRYHRIRSGETLSYIAGKYHTTVNKLCSLNHIRATTLLQIGRSLRVQ